MTGSAGEEDSSDSEPELVSSSLSSSSAQLKTRLVNVQLEIGDRWHLLCDRVQQGNLQFFRGGAMLSFLRVELDAEIYWISGRRV